MAAGNKQRLGAAGEAAVLELYLARGFELLDQNWRDGRRGEIDLVVGQRTAGAMLVVACEVKTRTSSAFGSGAEAITPTKQARMRRVATAWAMDHKDTYGWVDLRIDVAVVEWPRGATAPTIELIEGAC